MVCILGTCEKWSEDCGTCHHNMVPRNRELDFQISLNDLHLGIRKRRNNSNRKSIMAADDMETVDLRLLPTSNLVHVHNSDDFHSDSSSGSTIKNRLPSPSNSIRLLTNETLDARKQRQDGKWRWVCMGLCCEYSTPPAFDFHIDFLARMIYGSIWNDSDRGSNSTLHRVDDGHRLRVSDNF